MKRYFSKLTILIIVFLLFDFLLSFSSLRASEDKSITVIFLYDDVSALSPINLETKLINTFRKYNISFTFGVIPYVCSGEWRDKRSQKTIPLPLNKVKIIKDAIKSGTLEVILHGYSHQAVSNRGYCGETEFCGQHYYDQMGKIIKGKNYLEKQLNTRMSIFYPTWNSYDSNTIRVLEDLKFKTVFGMEYGYAMEGSVLNFLPLTCDLSYLHNALKNIKNFSDGLSVITVLIRERDLLGKNEVTRKSRFEEFSELIAWITSQNNIHVRSIKQTVRTIKDLSAHRFITYNSFLKSSHYLYPLIPPLFLNKMFPMGVYLSSKSAEDIKIKMLKIIIFFYFSILIISVIISLSAGLIVFPKFPFLASICRLGSIVGMVLLSVYAFAKLNFSHYRLLLETSLYAYRRQYYKVSVLIVLFFGACIGIWASWIIIKKKFDHD